MLLLLKDAQLPAKAVALPAHAGRIVERERVREVRRRLAQTREQQSQQGVDVGAPIWTPSFRPRPLHSLHMPAGSLNENAFEKSAGGLPRRENSNRSKV